MGDLIVRILSYVFVHEPAGLELSQNMVVIAGLGQLVSTLL